jgi:superfamily II DNA helicase RecQ
MNKISTTALARKYGIERDKLIKYFLDIGFIDRDENNKMILADKGIMAQGSYQQTENNSKYIVWNEDILDEGHNISEINLIEITKDKEPKAVYSNDFKRAINKLVDEKMSIEELSKTLDKEDKSNYQEILRLLITGFNPLTGEELSSNEIVNNPTVRKALMEIYEILNIINTKSENIKSTKVKRIEEDINLSQEDLKLYDRLREWRNRLAIEILSPPYVIASNKILKQISQQKPKTEEEFLSIRGINKNFFQNYSEDVVKIIEEYKNN